MRTKVRTPDGRPARPSQGWTRHHRHAGRQCQCVAKRPARGSNDACARPSGWLTPAVLPSGLSGVEAVGDASLRRRYRPPPLADDREIDQGVEAVRDRPLEMARLAADPCAGDQHVPWRCRPLPHVNSHATLRPTRRTRWREWDGVVRGEIERWGRVSLGRCRRHAVDDHPRETRRSGRPSRAGGSGTRAGSRAGREPGRRERSDGSWRSGSPSTGCARCRCWSRPV